jgi:hypothetical protein
MAKPQDQDGHGKYGGEQDPQSYEEIEIVLFAFVTFGAWFVWPDLHWDEQMMAVETKHRDYPFCGIDRNREAIGLSAVLIKIEGCALLFDWDGKARK